MRGETNAGKGGLVLQVLLPVLLVLSVFPSSAALAEDTVIYYTQDENGVFIFSDKQDTPEFRTYLVFREILRQGNVSKSEILRIAKKYSRIYGLDVDLVAAVIEVESNFQTDVVSSAGAEGLMQIMPETQKDLGVVDSFDPSDNIEAGVRYLKQMMDRFGDLELALAAYNAGPTNVEKYQGIPPFRETQDYVKKVLARYRNN